MRIREYEEFLNIRNCGGQYCKNCKFVDCCDELQQLTLELPDKLAKINYDNGVKIKQ